MLAYNHLVGQIFEAADNVLPWRPPLAGYYHDHLPRSIWWQFGGLIGSQKQGYCFTTSRMKVLNISHSGNIVQDKSPPMVADSLDARTPAVPPPSVNRSKSYSSLSDDPPPELAAAVTPPARLPLSWEMTVRHLRSEFQAHFHLLFGESWDAFNAWKTPKEQQGESKIGGAHLSWLFLR